MKTVNPNVVSSEISASANLKSLMERCGIRATGEGAKLSTNVTRELSGYLRCMSPRFVNKFLSDDENPSLICFAARIPQPKGEAYAYAWARKDKLSIDIDLAVLPLDAAGNPGEFLSAIYEPTFGGRTTLSVDTFSELEECSNRFTMSNLSSMSEKLFNAFMYCEGQKWDEKKQEGQT